MISTIYAQGIQTVSLCVGNMLSCMPKAVTPGYMSETCCPVCRRRWRQATCRKHVVLHAEGGDVRLRVGNMLSCMPKLVTPGYVSETCCPACRRWWRQVVKKVNFKKFEWTWLRRPLLGCWILCVGTFPKPDWFTWHLFNKRVGWQTDFSFISFISHQLILKRVYILYLKTYR